MSRGYNLIIWLVCHQSLQYRRLQWVCIFPSIFFLASDNDFYSQRQDEDEHYLISRALQTVKYCELLPQDQTMFKANRDNDNKYIICNKYLYNIYVQGDPRPRLPAVPARAAAGRRPQEGHHWAGRRTVAATSNFVELTPWGCMVWFILKDRWTIFLYQLPFWKEIEVHDSQTMKRLIA